MAKIKLIAKVDSDILVVGPGHKGLPRQLIGGGDAT